MSYAWIDLGDGRQVYRRVYTPIASRSDLAAPMVLRDDMPAGVHPFDGKEYTSKSAWRQANRIGGYIEVGNDPARLKPKAKAKADRQGIQKSIAKAMAGIRAK